MNCDLIKDYGAIVCIGVPRYDGSHQGYHCAPPGYRIKDGLAFTDKCVWEAMQPHKWVITSKNYVQKLNEKNKPRLGLHRFAVQQCGSKEDKQHTRYSHNLVDHINGVRKDCRLINLRVRSHRGNCMNRHAGHGRELGVYQRKNGRWQVDISCNGKRYTGCHDTKELAARAAKRIRREIEETEAVALGAQPPEKDIDEQGRDFLDRHIERHTNVDGNEENELLRSKKKTFEPTEDPCMAVLGRHTL
jgi:hypothetical protein